MDLILASGSPRRRELLQRAGFEFRVLTSSADESYEPGTPPAQVAPLLASVKARAVAQTLRPEELDNSVLVGADTIVALDGVIYGKPADEEDARRMLAELSGRTHQVITGVCVIAPSGEHCFAEQTDVTFRSLNAAEIDEYVASGEPLDKAGAYGIQGLGGALVAGTKGDFDNVVGLPVTRLAPLLHELLG
ncbi:MAG: Maf family protein [Coriobacteriales bacterium]